MAPRGDPPGRNDHVTGRYGLYKRGTQKVLDWLVDTADRCCDIRSMIGSLRPVSSETKTNTKTKPGKPKEEQKELVNITTQEIMALAIAIVDSPGKSIQMPAQVFYILEDVIKGRKQSAAWYQSSDQDGTMADGNRSHQHFIALLEKIRDMFAALGTRDTDKQPLPGTAKKSNKSNKSDKMDSLSNLFAHLHVDESADLDDASPGLETAAAPSKTMHFTLYDLKAECDEEFAVWCFLQDLSDVRAFVYKTWVEFAQGEITFLAAITVMDIAICLMQCADLEFSAQHDMATDFPTMLKVFGYTSMYDVKTEENLGCFEVDVGKVGRMKSLESSDSNSYPISDLLPFHGFVLNSRLFFQLLHHESNRLGVPLSFKESFDAFLRNDQENPRSEFAHVLSKLSLQLSNGTHFRSQDELHENGTIAMHRDDVLRNIMEAQQLRPEDMDRMIYPMWLIYSLQIYMDLYGLIGVENMGHGVDTLRQECARLRVLAKSGHAREYDNPSTNQMYSDWEKDLNTRYDALQLEDDPAPKSFYWIPTDEQRKAQGNLLCTGSMLARSFPVIPGQALEWMKWKGHITGCEAANDQLSLVIAAAHIYQAFKALGVITTEWRDMDFVIANQSQPGDPLVPKGRVPSDAPKILQRFVSTTNMMCRSYLRSRKLLARGLNGRIRVTSRYVRAAAQLENTDDFSEVHSRPKTVEQILHSLTEADIRPPAKGKGKRKQEQLFFTPLQLLLTFQRIFVADEVHLNFDYHSLTADCLQLFRSMRELVPLERESDRASLSTALRLAGDLGKYCDVKGLAKDTKIELPADSLSGTAARLMNQHILERGNKYLTLAQSLSSGHIPGHLRPDFGNRVKQKVQDWKSRLAASGRLPVPAVEEFPRNAWYHPCYEGAWPGTTKYYPKGPMDYF